MTRMLAIACLALALSACSGRRDGWDGMDGAGVAFGVKGVLERPGR